MSVNARVQLDIQGFIYTLPINPIEFQNQLSFQHFLDYPIDSAATRFTSLYDDRLRVMTWKSLGNKYPYTQLLSGLRSALLLSGVRIKYRDLDIAGDLDEWIDIFVENVRVVFNSGRGKSNVINNLSYDIEMMFTLA